MANNTYSESVNGYLAFYKDKRVEVHATSPYGAQLIAQKLLKVKDSQRYMITVVLAEKGGEEVVHLPLG